MAKSNSRAVVADILSSLLSGSGSLSTHLANTKDLPESSLIQESCYGCCRWFFLLEAILDQLLNKPLKKKDLNIKCLLINGLYQLRELDLAEYAIISESVSAVEVLSKPWAKGLVNAVLRNYLRGKDKIEASLNSLEDSRRNAFPPWLFSELEKQWPGDIRSIMSNSNKRPPLSLRVNLSKGSREGYLQNLEQAGLAASPGQIAPSAVYLAKPSPVSAIPGFEQGLVSVQDEASQLVPGLLSLQPGMRLLDACAAPGGKTCHLLESERLLTECIAIDMGPSRLGRIEENLVRLGLEACLVNSDAADLDNWWDGKAFDRILLDAPCSATAVIRRHPDIKLLRQAKDIAKLVAIQRHLLASLWKCLKPGGLLLYSTCSLLRQENEELVTHFLESTDNAKYEGIAADWGVECRFGRQLLPGDENGPDGFFFCPLRKSPS